MSTDTNSLANDPVSHFDSRASDWSGLYKRASFADRLHQFVSRAEKLVDRGGHILDYGCGTGVLARALSHVGFRVTGVDAAAKMVEEAKNAGGSHELAFRHIDSATWPDTDETYDAIVCSSVLEYIPDHEEMLQKLSSRLNPGGSLIISVPNAQSFVGRLEDRISRLVSRRKRDVEFCNRRYTAMEFRQQLSKVDIETTDVGYFELPKLGRLGIRPSRSKYLGVMMIVAGRKRADADGSS